MFSVIFEVHPKEGKKDEYLGLAKHLKPLLEAINGFIDNERFESKLRPGWVLSHSTWRDESVLSAGGPKPNIMPCRKKDGMRYSKTTACGSAR
jgi:heme-degrading monooxygenase HmoA